MTGTVTGGGRKEEETLSINHKIEGSMDGVPVEVRGQTIGFYVRHMPNQAGEEDTLYVPGDEHVSLDDGTRIEPTAPPDLQITPYDQMK